MTPAPKLSPRLQAVVEALPLRPDSRVLEIGCGPGAAARAIAARLTTRAQPRHRPLLSGRRPGEGRRPRRDASGRMDVRHVAAEDFVLEPGETPYDLVFAVRVGALDGRHPKSGERALQRIALATTANARLFIDVGDPLRELPLPKG